MERKPSHNINKTDTQPPVYLKEWRMVNGLSQTELADRMGVSKSEISRLESAKRKTSLGWLERYSAALGIVREQLFTPPGVTMVRREQVTPVTHNFAAPEPAPAPAPAIPKQSNGVGPFGLSASQPYMFVMASEKEYLLIDSSRGRIVARLVVS